jgi:serine/threonine protein kinase
MLEAAEGLAYLHSQEVVHGDIKDVSLWLPVTRIATLKRPSLIGRSTSLLAMIIMCSFATLDSSLWET